MKLRHLVTFLILGFIAFLTAQPAMAQLHPGVDTVGTVLRAPWQNGMVLYKKTHTSAATTSDTLLVKGVTSRDHVFYTRTAPPGTTNTWSQSWHDQPSITLKSDSVIVAFVRADTATYNIAIARRR